ncbi:MULTISPECIES: amino acid ABC transporter permease [unclassified Leucobacter]|uniref:amino acid ABC transporter permease n=1 Tax=unclassified Leucobacter TaxID=2621730 RepID=UPI00165E39B2|nr:MULTISPECIES: amino acid ABC transporter permease [unclassified Leucobacter]MBC9937507.1 amino acid ABC transporter permease [Leucobacter sp. cx-87]
MTARTPLQATPSHDATPTTVSRTLTSLDIRPRRHPWRVASAVAVGLLLVFALFDVATNQRFGWATVGEYLFNPQILQGAWLTLFLTVISMTIGILLGACLAIMRLSSNPVLSNVSRGYIWFFRGTPLLVQLIFWYNIAALYPVIALGLPFGGPSIELGSANVLITPLVAALLGLSLNEAAYMAEIIRGGISSIDPGQRDAGRAIGMKPGLMMTRVILPQAMRVVLPPTGNQVISMLKGTSLVSVLAISDLLYSAQIIYALNYKTIPLLLVACIWYLAMTTVLTFFQGKLEQRYGRGFQPRKLEKRSGARGKAAALAASAPDPVAEAEIERKDLA